MLERLVGYERCILNYLELDIAESMLERLVGYERCILNYLELDISLNFLVLSLVSVNDLYSR